MAETKFVKSRQVREVTVTLAYSDTSSTELFKLPKSARVLGYAVGVQTAFDGGATLSVGTSSDADHYIQTLDVTSAGNLDITASDTQNAADEMSSVTSLYGIINGSPTQGSLELTVLFSLKQGTPLV